MSTSTDGAARRLPPIVLACLAALGIVLGGESVTFQEWAATGVILAGVILLLAGPVRRGAD